ncbi:MAG: DUF4134 domain-containing protein [Bacteroidales bacterium]|jgi:hypothetical protein|nr:DUF4134 domain-containing protein [Bacteroidales bacterium]
MKKIKNKARTICAALFVAICTIMLFVPEQTHAQSTGISKAKTALNTVAGDISGLYDTVSKVLFAIAALIALVGGIIVYSKWTHGDPNAAKLVAAWLGSILFFVASGVLVRAMFL